METLPFCYTILFNRITDALSALEHQNYGQAREILIRAQQEAEEAYLSYDEP